MPKASLTAFTDTNAGSFEMKNSLLSRVHVRGVVAADGGEDIVAAVKIPAQLRTLAREEG